MRYDVFEMIYEMLFDNIQLRVKQNKLSARTLTLSQLNIDKTVSNYFRKNHVTICGASKLQSIKFKARLLERKNKGKGTTPGWMGDGAQPPSYEPSMKSEQSMTEEFVSDEYGDEMESK